MPAKGSLSEQRALKAKIHLLNELIGLCLIIDKYGETKKDHMKIKTIKFGVLFNMYADISNKVTGLLVRAKRQGVLEYEGEALFQGKDDNVIINLVTSIKKIRKDLKEKIKTIELDLKESVEYQKKNGPIYS